MENKKEILNVTITGACGKISFELLPLLCNGLVFGPNQKIALNLYDLPVCEKKLQGVQMEIEDCAFPLVDQVKLSTNPKDAFTDCDVGILIASYPHRPGMERKELISKNNDIFKEIGESINSYASPNVRIVVVANPVNSLLTLLAHYADKIPKQNFTGLSRLDYNRAKYLLAKTCNTTTDKIKDLIVWGNHSDSQFPDVFHCKVDGKPIQEAFAFNPDWLHTTYVETIANRWKQIVDYTGGTSIMGPANAIKDHIRDWFSGTEPGDYASMAVIADGNAYGVPKGVGFSLPCVTKNFVYKVVSDFALDEFTKTKIEKSYKEIIDELELIGFSLSN